MDINNRVWLEGRHGSQGGALFQAPDNDTAIRIVACMNACRGIPTEELHDGCLSDARTERALLRKQAGELAQRLEEAQDELQKTNEAFAQSREEYGEQEGRIAEAHAALKVICRDPKLRKWLKYLDPKALEQACKACGERFGEPDGFKFWSIQGFYLTGTGGGCEAFQRDLAEGLYVLVTIKDGGDVPEYADQPVYVGLYGQCGTQLAYIQADSSPQAVERIAEGAWMPSGSTP